LPWGDKYKGFGKHAEILGAYVEKLRIRFILAGICDKVKNFASQLKSVSFVTG
jgi:hypothetical protein